MRFKLYPDQGPAAVGRAAADVLFLAWTAAAVVAGVAVHQLVLRLNDLANAVIAAGQALNGWLEGFRDTPAGNVPVVGPALTQYIGKVVDHVQAGSGERIVRYGNAASDAVSTLALVLAIAVAALLILAVTAPYVLWRWRESRARGGVLAYVRAAAASGRLEEAQAVLGVRAVATLPLSVIAQVSADPVGDLRAGEYRPLSVALLRGMGLADRRLPAAAAPAARRPPN
jgi:hypothetical protein